MARKNKNPLTDEERCVIKSLIARGWTNQDIQHLINTGRSNTINPGRIAEVKKENIKCASAEETDYYLLRKNSYNHKTGLNTIDDERLIRAREAMILAVQNFNSPAILFKSEQFSVLAIIAWTCLFHQYFIRHNMEIKNKNTQKMISLSDIFLFFKPAV